MFSNRPKLPNRLLHGVQKVLLKGITPNVELFCSSFFYIFLAVGKLIKPCICVYILARNIYNNTKHYLIFFFWLAFLPPKFTFLFILFSSLYTYLYLTPAPSPSAFVSFNIHLFYQRQNDLRSVNRYRVNIYVCL